MPCFGDSNQPMEVDDLPSALTRCARSASDRFSVPILIRRSRSVIFVLRPMTTTGPSNASAPNSQPYARSPTHQLKENAKEHSEVLPAARQFK